MGLKDLAGQMRPEEDAPGREPVIRAAAAEVFRWSPVDRERVLLLTGVEWRVDAGQHWVVMGPNGAGKTTLLRMAAAESHPSRGTVEVLGERLGATDMRRLRERIGLVDSRTAQGIPPSRTALDTVVSGAFSSIALQYQRLTTEHRERAAALLGVVGLDGLANRQFGHCSQGEHQRVLLARALMPDPRLLLLDEPASGLDLPSRERLLEALVAMAANDRSLTTVTITHHLEEVAPSVTHALLLRDGRVLAAGPVADTLTSKLLSDCFGLPVSVSHAGGRFGATLVSPDA